MHLLLKKKNELTRETRECARRLLREVTRGVFSPGTVVEVDASEHHLYVLTSNSTRTRRNSLSSFQDNPENERQAAKYINF